MCLFRCFRPLSIGEQMASWRLFAFQNTRISATLIQQRKAMQNSANCVSPRILYDVHHIQAHWIWMGLDALLILKRASSAKKISQTHAHSTCIFPWGTLTHLLVPGAVGNILSGKEWNWNCVETPPIEIRPIVETAWNDTTSHFTSWLYYDYSNPWCFVGWVLLQTAVLWTLSEFAERKPE